MKRLVPDGGAVKAGIPALAVESVAGFKPGDVVVREKIGPGIVTEVDGRFLAVAYADGSQSFGSGLSAYLKHREPRANIPIPPGALGERWWTRKPSVTAALKRLDRAEAAGPARQTLTGAEKASASADAWLTKTIKAVKERTNG